MGKDKVVELPLQSSIYILSTYKRLKEKLNECDNFLYIEELTGEDIKIIERVFAAATIIGGLGMRSGYQYATARARLESLIGNQEYPIELYRTFTRAYSDLLKYRSLYKIQEVDSELEHKLA